LDFLDKAVQVIDQVKIYSFHPSVSGELVFIVIASVRDVKGFRLNFRWGGSCYMKLSRSF
jgi:hypothetical protein